MFAVCDGPPHCSAIQPVLSWSSSGRKTCIVNCSGGTQRSTLRTKVRGHAITLCHAVLCFASRRVLRFPHISLVCELRRLRVRLCVACVRRRCVCGARRALGVCCGACGPFARVVKMARLSRSAEDGRCRSRPPASLPPTFPGERLTKGPRLHCSAQSA